MAVKQRYGMNADGSVTRCRAKPGNVGRYGCTHGRHEDLTDEQAMEINERAAAATSPSTGSSLTKSARIDQNGVEADVMREMYGGGDSELANRRMRESAVRDILDGALYVEPEGTSRPRCLTRTTRLQRSNERALRYYAKS